VNRMEKKGFGQWIPWVGGILGVLLVLIGLYVLFNRSGQSNTYQSMKIPSGQAKAIKLFSLNIETKKEAVENFQVHKEAALRHQLSQMIEQMARQPENEKMRSLWPLPLKVRSAYLRKNGFLILDFEKGVQYNQSNSAFDELAAIYLIVRTITANYEQIKQVKFLIGGQETETLAGHIDISRPLKLSDLKW
jgi:Sporulation and spore germination